MLVPTRDDMRPAQQGGVSLWYIATRAGLSGRSDNYVLNYVRHLSANENFPPALPRYSLKGGKQTDITFQSRWLRTAVDAWFDGFLPPHLVAVAVDAQAARDAQTLDQRAEQLVAAGAGR